jgi:hypothetical protein
MIRVEGPVAAAVTYLRSLMELEAGIMEPSVAHKVLLWAEGEGENLHETARA